jgi:hypothetical protein
MRGTNGNGWIFLNFLKKIRSKTMSNLVDMIVLTCLIFHVKSKIILKPVLLIYSHQLGKIRNLSLDISELGEIEKNKINSRHSRRLPTFEKLWYTFMRKL